MATDPIIKDHQLWIGFVQPEGLVVSPHALKNAQAVLSHNVGVQQEILRRHMVTDFDGNLRLKSFPAFTQEFWGWRDSDLAAPPDDLFARLPEYGETLRSTWVVKGAKGQPEHLILGACRDEKADADLLRSEMALGAAGDASFPLAVPTQRLTTVVHSGFAGR